MGNFIEAYLSKKGEERTPEHSEYDLGTTATVKVLAVHNAHVVDKRFVIVEDEMKPVYFIASRLACPCQLLHKVDFHCLNESGKKSMAHLNSSDCGVQIVEEAFFEDGKFFFYIKMRRGNTYCSVGNYHPNAIEVENDEVDEGRAMTLASIAKSIDLLMSKLLTDSEKPGDFEVANEVTLTDVLQFVSKEISWEELLTRAEIQVIKVFKD